MQKEFYLMPVHDRAKSFYNKAVVIETENAIYLKSYNTIVCKIVNGKIFRLWGGYSATTMRHVNSFVDTFNINGGGKKWWCNLEVCED